jgi:filamentous hemagglutinin family protein
LNHFTLSLPLRVVACLLLTMGLPPLSQAQIRTDSSLGHAAQSLTGPNYVIPQSIGLLSGNNLFESFSTFNLASGESANFFTTSTNIANIISRVTGGTASILNGNINVIPAGGAPNFFFINPAGVTFGAGASINVPAAFHVSTANYLKFPNGRFYSDTAHVSTFSSLAPEAFGFLGTTRATIDVADNTFLGQGGAPITVTAGDIVVDNATIATFGGGDVRIAAVGQDNVEVPLTGNLPVLHGNLNVVDGGSIAAIATTTDSGNVLVSAGNIGIDGRGSSFFTGIYTDTPQGSTGNAAVVDIRAGSINLTNAGAISSTSESSGNAGLVNVAATGAITLDAAALIYSAAYDSGNASQVNVTAGGTLALSGHAQIFSAAYDTGNAGSIAINADNITLVSDNKSQGTAIYSGAADGTGNAGNVTVNASNLGMAGGASIGANTQSAGNAGSVNINLADNLDMTSGSIISSSTEGAGSAGAVSVSAANIALTGNASSFTGIASNSLLADSGASGSVTVTTPGALTILSGAGITSTSSSPFDGGSIKVSAGSLLINGGDQNVDATGISSSAVRPSDRPYALGSAGTVDVDVRGALTILNGGGIGSDSEQSFGNSGSVRVSAGSLLIDSQGNAAGASISSDSNSYSPNAHAGNVQVNVAGNLTLVDSGEITSDSYILGDAGSVFVSAGNIAIVGSGLGSTAGISSQSLLSISGNAGTVDVSSANGLTITNGGSISTSTTSATGRAGTINVNARYISIDGFGSTINAEAVFGSSGQTGNVTVTASNSITLSNEGELTIANAGTAIDPQAVKQSLLNVSAPLIEIDSGAAISALSVGNVAASNIKINFGSLLALDEGAISTDDIKGNGGSINISGNGLLNLQKSSITTSVFGSSGNGGDIQITSGILILDSGFIQANTVADKGQGGTVVIDTPALLTSGDSLFLGGSTPYSFGPEVFGYNVIQAAAPTGISGAINISNPALNLAGSLTALGGKVLEGGALGRDRCQTRAGSSLTLGGRGGLAPSAHSLVRADPPAASASPAAANLDSRPKPNLLLAQGECPEQ